LSIQAVAAGKPASQQSETKELSAKEHNKDRNMEGTSDMAATATNRITSILITLLQPIVEALNKILDGEDSMEHIIDGIFRYIRESEKMERLTREKQEVQVEVSALCKAFRADLSKLQDNFSIHLDGITSIINVTLETTEKVLTISEEIKGSSSDIISKLGKVTNIADKIADTTQSYCNVLVMRQAQMHKASTPPRILGDIECRAKQILINIYNEKGNNT
jgi:hypothetical protein